MSITPSNPRKMSFNNNNNNYTTAPTSPNPYVSRKINNMDQALVMKMLWDIEH